MKQLKVLLAAGIVALFGAFALVPATTVGAVNPLEDVCQNDPGSEVCANQDEDAGALIGTLVNVLLFIVGSLAVIMIIVSGIWYVISSGDAGKVARAKNTLMYSVVGLVVAFVAYAIVNWVLDLF